jgi:hypothetical protein
VFAGTWRARLIGTDDFKETGHTRYAIYLWAALQTHIISQGYIELGFIARPKLSSVVVEHLIQMCVPMAMHEALKTEMVGLKASVKASVATVEKLESAMAPQATEFAKLFFFLLFPMVASFVQQDMALRGDISFVGFGREVYIYQGLGLEKRAYVHQAR